MWPKTFTVRSGNKQWSSPDGKVSIYEVVGEDGYSYPTLSRKLGEGAGKTFEIMARADGKVDRDDRPYIVQVPREDEPQRYPAPSPMPSELRSPTPGQSPAAPGSSSAALDRLEALVSRLEAVVDVLAPKVVQSFYPTPSRPVSTAHTPSEQQSIQDFDDMLAAIPEGQF